MMLSKLNLYIRPTNAHIKHIYNLKFVVFYSYFCECTLMKFAIAT